MIICIHIEDIETIKYCKGELIGSGAYGKVYQGLDTTNGHLVAIKSIHVSCKFNNIYSCR